MSDPGWSIVMLRYFNPVGAHPTGIIGEDPLNTPNNLMPYIAQVAAGRLRELSVFDNDYNTQDGTGVRDYIHVCDLARGHVAALSLLDAPRCTPINLGTGNGFSVLEIVKAFEKTSGQIIARKFVGRRVGDIDMYYADPKVARELMNWHASLTIDDMCCDLWRWQSMNPNGYADISTE